MGMCMSDSTDAASQVAAKQAEIEQLRYEVLTLKNALLNSSRDYVKMEKAFQEMAKKYEDLLNQLGATDA